MKTSISVPDELWNQARSRFHLGGSDLVQAALRQCLATPDPWADSALRPAGIEGAFDAVQQQLAIRARKAFEGGYKAALEVAPKLPWNAIEDLAEDKAFDIERWANRYRAEAADVDDGFIDRTDLTEDDLKQSYAIAVTLRPALGCLAWAPSDPFPPPAPGDTFTRGFAQAFRDLWASVPDAAKALVTDREGVPER